MDKISLSHSLQKSIDTLKNSECSQRDKLALFSQITDSVKSLRHNASYQNHVSSAINILLLFCEESDSVIRMNAEENLNKIFRHCEHGNIDRMQKDLFHEIKKNGHERSLRICLNLFAYYCHLIKQRKSTSYAQNLLLCIFAISKRKETTLIESLSAFVQTFCLNLESFMTDGEVLKLIELFIDDVISECPVKRRCAIQNALCFIEKSRNAEYFASIALNKIIGILIKNQKLNCILGSLGFLRMVLPILLSSEKCDDNQIIEIYDISLHYLNDQSHNVINASLEVLNTIFMNLNAGVKSILLGSRLAHRDILLKRKSLKNIIFKIALSESIVSSRKSSADTIKNENKQSTELLKIEKSLYLHPASTSINAGTNDDTYMASSIDMEIESFKSMEFNSEISLSQSFTANFKECDEKLKSDNISLKSQKSTESIGSFINTLLTSTNAETVSKYFRKSLDSPSEMSTSTNDKQIFKFSDDDNLSNESIASHMSSISINTDTVVNELEINVGEPEKISQLKEEAGQNTKQNSMLAISMLDESVSDTHSYHVFIGTIYDQNILEYTARLLCSKFLLNGSKGNIISDQTVRVSIKNMSLMIIANCVVIKPEILGLCMEKELIKQEFDVIEILNLEDPINDTSESSTGARGEILTDSQKCDNFLEIKDDHFGECTTATYFDYFSPMSISLDQGLISLKSKLKAVEENNSENNNEKLSEDLDKILSHSEFMDRRKSEILVVPRIINTAETPFTNQKDKQYITDILLFYNHYDPVLRGNVQILIGNFIASVLNNYQDYNNFVNHNCQDENSKAFLRIDRLIHIVIEGFCDEIHTVVKQALSAFETLFEIYLQKVKFDTITIYQSNTIDTKHCVNVNNDILLYTEQSINMSLEKMLNKLMLVFHNKYWIVQCKYCDIISNLNFGHIKSIIGNGTGIIYQKKCLRQLYLLLKDNDFRVRNHAGKCLLLYIQSISPAEDCIPFKEYDFIEKFIETNILIEFSDPIGKADFKPINNKILFNKNVAMVMYSVSNHLLSFHEKNQMFGTIHFLKLFLIEYDAFDFIEIWKQFNILNVVLVLLAEYSVTTLDITCHSDLLEICTTLLLVLILNEPEHDDSKIDFLLSHILKLLNIYYHLFTNTKPVIMSRIQKSDIFLNSKELNMLNGFGYFGNDVLNLKLYEILKNSFENYKITINCDVGVKLMELLSSSIKALNKVLNIKNISSMANGLKFIEEILNYLMTFTHYEPVLCIECTKYLLKFLFARNYINRTKDFEYFSNKNFENIDSTNNIEFFDKYSELYVLKYESDIDLSSYIKIFEPIVIQSLKLFCKTNAVVQTSILDMLCLLLELKVNYHLLDANNAFIDSVHKHIELIETGSIKNSEHLIKKIIKFLFILSKQKDKKIITVPKIINITDTLLANNMIRSTSIFCLQELSHELFFMNKLNATDNIELHKSELLTQREVVFNMLMKFCNEIHVYKHISPIILLSQQLPCPTYEIDLLTSFLSIIKQNKLVIKDEVSFRYLVNLFMVMSKNVLMESKNFENILFTMFEYYKDDSVNQLHKLVLLNVFFEKILLKTEETFLLNHVTLYMSNNQSVNPCNDDDNNSAIFFVTFILNCLKKSFKDFSINNCFYDYLLKRFLKTLSEIKKYNIIVKVFKKEFNFEYFPIIEHNITICLCDLLMDYDYDAAGIMQHLQHYNKNLEDQNFVANVYEKLIRKKHVKDWTNEEITIIIGKHLELFIHVYNTFLCSIISDEKYSDVIVSNVIELMELNDARMSPSKFHLYYSLLYRSHIKSFRIMSQTLIDNLSSKSLMTCRNSAMILNIKFDYLKTIKKEDVNNILPEDIFVHIVNLFDLNERKTRYSKINKSLNQLSGCYSRSVNNPIMYDEKFNINYLKNQSVDENWFMEQLKYHCTNNYMRPKNVSHMLYEIKTESKLINLLSLNNFNMKLLRDVINISFENMIYSFRIDCIQYNPHLNYLKIHPLLKVSLIVLMKKIDDFIKNSNSDVIGDESAIENCIKSVINFLDHLNRLEHICLIYTEAKHIDKFIKEHILKSNFYDTLIMFGALCAKSSLRLMKTYTNYITKLELNFKLIDLILRQKYLWNEFNQNDKYDTLKKTYVEMIFKYLKLVLNNAIYRNKYKNPDIFNEFIEYKYKMVESYLQVIFIAKYIEERNDAEIIEKEMYNNVSNSALSLSVNLLKTDQYYLYSVTPFEVLDCYTFDMDSDFLRLPSIPIDYLYDVDILKKFIRRVNLFGYSSRQQFEELFMSLLVLANKVCEPEVVDFQEQYEIKNICLIAITELLISCFKYPRLGFYEGKFHHYSRLNKLKIDNVGLKKLHNIQLLNPITNIFYQPNLERCLINTNYDDLLLSDNIIGTKLFQINQFGMNYMWEIMEDNYSNVDRTLIIKNATYFIERIGIDLTSSIQLIYDMFGQLIDDNYMLVLPYLVKFCEFCVNREQLKWINMTMTTLQEKVPIENTLSHQYIIYLLCKSHALLIPSFSDLVQLCTLIPTYLKSTQLYIRNATLNGLLCLLECLINTNTTIGSLSEELLLVRNIIINYIIKHGIIDESSITFSDNHTKLVWSLNFYLIETTSKFVPDCNLLSNSIISANNILKRTTNLDIYLCILNGLERMVVSNTTNRLLMEKIEKLALDLIKLDNEMFSLSALKLLISCVYFDAADQLENTDRSNGIVQDDPEIIIQQIEKIEILFAKIRTTTPQGAKIFGDTLCQIIRDLLPPNEILTKVFKELMLNQPNPDIIANVTHQVFRSAIDSSYLSLLQEWLLCSLPNFLSFPQINKSVWCLTVIFISSSLNQYFIKLFPEILSLSSYHHLNKREMQNFILSAKDFYDKLSQNQKIKFKEIFKKCDEYIYKSMLESL